MIEPHVYSVLDDDGIAHDVIPFGDGTSYVKTVCFAWRNMRVHSQMAKLKPNRLQPVTCLLCLCDLSCVDAPQFLAKE